MKLKLVRQGLLFGYTPHPHEVVHGLRPVGLFVVPDKRVVLSHCGRVFSTSHVLERMKRQSKSMISCGVMPEQAGWG